MSKKAEMQIEMVRFLEPVSISSANEMTQYLVQGADSVIAKVKTKLSFDDDDRFLRVETNRVDLIPLQVCCIRLKEKK